MGSGHSCTKVARACPPVGEEANKAAAPAEEGGRAPEASSGTAAAKRVSPLSQGQAVELGDINYCNLTKDRRHGDFDAALQEAARTGKPIFANFVEWSG